MRWRESALIRSLAALLGVGAAVAYFLLAPAPPSRRERFSRPTEEWREWRTRAVQQMAARLKRHDPADVTRAVFQAHHDNDWSRALSYGTEGRQRRFTPDSMRARLTRFAIDQPALSRVDEPVLVGDRAAVPFVAQDALGVPRPGHAVLLRVADGWRLEALDFNGSPDLPGDSEGVRRARLVYPGDAIFQETHDASTPRVATERLLLALRARRNEPLRDEPAEPLLRLLDPRLSRAPHPGQPRDAGRFPLVAAFFHPELLDADDARVLRVRARENHAEARIALVGPDRAALRIARCVRVESARPGEQEWRVSSLRRPAPPTLP